MAEFISRSEAARLLGCTPQTISNYVKAGFIDEFRREKTGRPGIYYDKSQVEALVPEFRELDELKARIEQEKEALHDELMQLGERRRLARERLKSFVHGEKTWKRYKEIIEGALGFVVGGKGLSYFDRRILSYLLELEDFETICIFTGASTQEVNGAVGRILRYLSELESVEETLRENEMLRQANRKMNRLYFHGDGEHETGREEAISLARRLYPYPVRVTELGLSPKALSPLLKLGVKTLYDLVGYSKEEIAGIKGIGPGCVSEIVDTVEGMGLSLAKF